MLYLYFDGASKGNPGPAGSGYLLTDHKGFKCTGTSSCGTQTNNFAEYTALIEGLKAYQNLEIKPVLNIQGDSKLVIEQVKGNWKCKSSNLKPLYEEAIDILNTVGSWDAKWIPRDKNHEADKLANEGIR